MNAGTLQEKSSTVLSAWESSENELSLMDDTPLGEFMPRLRGSGENERWYVPRITGSGENERWCGIGSASLGIVHLAASLRLFLRPFLRERNGLLLRVRCLPLRELERLIILVKLTSFALLRGLLLWVMSGGNRGWFPRIGERRAVSEKE